jgi:hypothetical protein
MEVARYKTSTLAPTMGWSSRSSGEFEGPIFKSTQRMLCWLARFGGYSEIITKTTKNSLLLRFSVKLQRAPLLPNCWLLPPEVVDYGIVGTRRIWAKNNSMLCCSKGMTTRKIQCDLKSNFLTALNKCRVRNKLVQETKTEEQSFFFSGSSAARTKVQMHVFS